MPLILTEILELLGFIIRLLGFLVFGYAVARFVLESYKTAEWQVKVALSLGFFGMAIAFTEFASAGSAGAFALGAGAEWSWQECRRRKARRTNSNVMPGTKPGIHFSIGLPLMRLLNCRINGELFFDNSDSTSFSSR